MITNINSEMTKNLFIIWPLQRFFFFFGNAVKMIEPSIDGRITIRTKERERNGASPLVVSRNNRYLVCLRLKVRPSCAWYNNNATLLLTMSNDYTCTLNWSSGSVRSVRLLSWFLFFLLIHTPKIPILLSFCSPQHKDSYICFFYLSWCWFRVKATWPP